MKTTKKKNPNLGRVVKEVHIGLRLKHKPYSKSTHLMGTTSCTYEIVLYLDDGSRVHVYNGDLRGYLFPLHLMERIEQALGSVASMSNSDRLMYQDSKYFSTCGPVPEATYMMFPLGGYMGVRG
jgi:hypothetical protein